MLCLGVITGRLIWSGGFGWFVQQRMRWPLILATGVLLIFGLYEALSGSREEQHDPDAVTRSKGPRIGWLMILPLLVLISVAPTGLGAAAADRVDAFTPTEANTDEFEPLDTSNGPVDMGLFEFLDRAIWDDQASLADVPVRMSGLVVNSDDVPDGFKLTRFMVSCCAADGIPLQVALRDLPQRFEDDTWVEVEAIWREPSTPYRETTGEWIIEADVLNVVVVEDPPTDAYESPY